MRVCFETFGCRLNKAEALQMEAEYLADGWKLTTKHGEADLIVVRGCSVTRRAQSECEQMIRHLREKYPMTKIEVCGCLEKRKSGTAHLPHLPGKRNVSKSDRTAATPLQSAEQPVPTRTARAYLKVQDGCSGKCTFCIVPKFRGKSASEAWDSVLDKAKRFIDAGYHEIVLTGCNLALYASGGHRLPDLTAALAELAADVRIRIGSLEPGACASEVVSTMAEHANICRFLHIPIQSGSNRILQAMGRPYSIRDVDELIDKAVRLMPKIGLGCDIMTGFPSEEPFDFTLSKNLLRRHPFNNAHVFPYSERPGTAAAGMFGAMPRAIRSARAHEILDLVKINRKRFAQSFVGKTVEVVVESDSNCRGWTSEYLTCTAVGTAVRKSLVKIRVADAKGDILSGRLLPSQAAEPSVRPMPTDDRATRA